MSIINGRYQLHESLGQGGMAEVFRATQINLEREVALKFIKPDAVAADFNKRFEREAKAIAQLNHPNITQVYDFEQAEDGRFYMVMELLRGQDLAAFLKPSPRLALPDILSIMGGVCAALDYAHQRGIVHRDVKPSNIFITDQQQVKLMDFGIAKWAAGGSLTESGAALGTPKYFAPEQARGEEVTARTDLYSLGVVFYELLTGQLPFQGDHIAALVMQHLQAPIPDPRLLRPALPPLATAIVLRALAKNPADRYPSIEAFWAEVATLEAEPSENLPPRLLPKRITQSLPNVPPGPNQDRSPSLLSQTQAGPLASTSTQTALASTLTEIRQGRYGWMVVAGLILFALLSLGAWLVLRNEAADVTPPPSLVAEITPAAPDEYLILVAQWTGDEGGVLQRRISDVVRTSDALAYSPNIRTRIELLPGPIQSNEQGQALAESVGAHLLIWGVQDELGVEVILQDIEAEPRSIPQLRFIVPAGPDFNSILTQEMPTGVRYYLGSMFLHHFVRTSDIDAIANFGFLTGEQRGSVDRLVAGTDLDQHILDLFSTAEDDPDPVDLATRALRVAPNDYTLRFLRLYNEAFYEGRLAQAETDALELYELMGSSNFSEWVLMNIYLAKQDYEQVMAISERLNPEQLGYSIPYSYRQLSLLMLGQFAQIQAEIEQDFSQGAVFGLPLWDAIRAMTFLIQGDMPAFEAAQARLQADRDLDNAAGLVASIEYPPFAFYMIGGIISELNADTATANLIYFAAGALNAEHYLLNWRRGHLQEAAGQIASAYILYGQAAAKAPVPFPIALYEQAVLAHNHADTLPDAAPPCELLGEARAGAESDPVFYAPLLERIRNTGGEWGC